MKHFKNIASTLANLVKTHKLDGLVVEIWNSLQEDAKEDAVHSELVKIFFSYSI